MQSLFRIVMSYRKSKLAGASAGATRNSQKLWTTQYEMRSKSYKTNEYLPPRSLFQSVEPRRIFQERLNCWRILKKREGIMLTMVLMMIIITITVIYFMGRVMTKVAICAQAVMRNLLPTLPNHVDTCLAETASRKLTVIFVDVDYPIPYWMILSIWNDIFMTLGALIFTVPQLFFFQPVPFRQTLCY